MASHLSCNKQDSKCGCATCHYTQNNEESLKEHGDSVHCALCSSQTLDNTYPFSLTDIATCINSDLLMLPAPQQLQNGGLSETTQYECGSLPQPRSAECPQYDQPLHMCENSKPQTPQTLDLTKHEYQVHIQISPQLELSQSVQSDELEQRYDCATCDYAQQNKDHLKEHVDVIQLHQTQELENRTRP